MPDLLRVPGSPPDPASVLRNNCRAGEASRTLLVPVVASLPGANGVRYATRLTLTNRSPVTSVVEVRFTPAEGTGGTGLMTLAGDAQTSVDAGALLSSLAEAGSNERDPEAIAVVARWKIAFPDKPAAAGLTLLNLVRSPAGWRVVHDASM